jgi:prepilin-type N-terminal cleavage/methylation domain-containing protein
MPLKDQVADEAGFSLAEILITIVIVSVTFAAILGGLMTSITVSSLHRKEATADAVARDAAEWVKGALSNPYMSCANTGTYTFAGLSVPSGYTASVTSVRYWDGTSSNPVVFGSSCPSNPDKGLQDITVVARSTDSSAVESVEILKRTAP